MEKVNIYNTNNIKLKHARGDLKQYLRAEGNSIFTNVNN